MTAPENALSLTIAGNPDLPGEVLKALYRITGRSTIELRNSIRAGEPVYTAALFGNDHIDVVPRLEKTAAYLDEIGAAFVVHEWADGGREQITRDVMREIIESADGDFR
ncbi:MAG: hypothetical protein JF592_14455 [Microbacterium sp.]|uniref:Uncharacterized protein n=1 Tax=Microbacterium natoriense TaxID=284570 RepID=A0AAW8F161_9MICO|nr:MULTISPECIES: hypothetical protein [Microbacterium]MBW8763761.1 hypothetical protein [Microbacterium sp.]MDQ0649495.1 hypothetical protein [Microbacterium natoriense]